MDWEPQNSSKDLAQQMREYGKSLGQHIGRYEGFRDTALIGAGTLAVVGAGYGLYRLWHWSKKPLLRFKDDLQSAIKNLNQADSRVIKQQTKDQNDQNYVIDENLKRDIEEAKNKLQSILKSVEKTLNGDKQVTEKK